MQGKGLHLRGSCSIVNSHGEQTYKTIILPILLFDCETWSLTLREVVNYIINCVTPHRLL